MRNQENEMTSWEQVDQLEHKSTENMALGMVGAVVGALIGGASIIGLSQLGYIASISGVLLAVCTLKGYELLAKGISPAGVLACSILMLVTPFAADWIDWTIALYEAWAGYGATFLDCMMTLPALFAEDPELLGEYVKNLGMLYLFVIMGGFYTVKNAFQKK